MFSPIESGRRLLTRNKLSIKGAVKGAMVVGGAAATFSGLGVFRTQRVDAQGPTPTPTATDIGPRPTDVINPVEPTPAPNQVLLKNPNTGECVLVVFPDKVDKNPDTTKPTPTPVADGQVIIAAAEPTTGPTSTPDLIAQVPGVDVAPLLQAKDDPTTWEPCLEGEEPTATMTAEPTVSPTEQPTSTPTIEPVPTPTAEPTAEPTTQPTTEPTTEPTKTPIPTQPIEATPKPILTPEEGIFDLEFKETTFNQLDNYAHRLFEPIRKDGLGKPPSVVLPPTSQFHNRNLKDMEDYLNRAKNGGELDNTPEEIEESRKRQIYEISIFGYTVYKESGDMDYLILARKAHWHGESEFGESEYDKFVQKRIKEDGGFTF